MNVLSGNIITVLFKRARFTPPKTGMTNLRRRGYPGGVAFYQLNWADWSDSICNTRYHLLKSSRFSSRAKQWVSADMHRKHEIYCNLVEDILLIYNWPNKDNSFNLMVWIVSLKSIIINNHVMQFIWFIKFRFNIFVV